MCYWLTATIGIAANKPRARIASDHQKPEGLTLISEKDKVQFLRPLSVRALYGIGRITESVLNEDGIRTVGNDSQHKARSSERTALRAGELGPAPGRAAVCHAADHPGRRAGSSHA